MNKIFRHTILSACFAVCTLSFTACDDINETERIIKGTPTSFDKTYETSTIVIENETFTINDEHRLLITDFTGWKCVNCPTVAEYLTTMITPTYPSVLVSLHMNTNAFSANHPDGYNCASADEIANWIYGSNIASQLSLPSVSIDNVEYNGNVLNSNTDDLGNLAAERNKACNVTKTATQANLSVNISDKGNDTFSISTLIMCPKEKECTLRLWLIEEGLISRLQYSLSGTIRNYKNHGILREVINESNEGQNVTLNAEGQAVIHTDFTTQGKNYKPENCHVVAFITKKGGKEIINCAEVSLTKSE